MEEKKKKISKIAVKIIALVIVPILMLSIALSLTGSIKLGSVSKNDEVKILALATYAIEKEVENMNADNTLSETVNYLIDDFKNVNGIDITIFAYNTRVFTTIVTETVNGLERITGTPMSDEVWEAIQTGEPYFSKNTYINDVKYYVYYKPIMENGKCVGALFAGESADIVDRMILDNMAVTFFSALGLGAIFIITSTIITIRIVKRIKKVDKINSDLSSNDLSQTYELYEIEHDELETLFNNSANFKEQLKTFMNDIQDMAENIQASAIQLRDSAESTSNASNEIADAMESIAQGATSQADETMGATENIGNISEQLEVIKNTVVEMDNASSSMNDAKNSAVNSIVALDKANETIVASIKTTNEQVAKTSERVKEIQKAVDGIRGIADQTNLLALNANIEAARVGEQGRGFAVVASNVGELATQAGDLSNTIDKIIKGLTKDYALIEENMEGATQHVEFQSDKIKETHEMITVLENDIDKAVQMIEQVDKMVTGINASIKTMVDSISTLSAISEENSASTEETLANVNMQTTSIAQILEGAQLLEGVANSLMEIVSVFKTK